MNKNGNKGKKYNGKLSLYPMKFEEAVKGLLEVKPEIKGNNGTKQNESLQNKRR